MSFIIPQIVGIIAVALFLWSFQLKKRRQIVFVTCVTNCLYVLQYFLLGAFSGAILDVLATVSSFFAGKKNAPGFRRYAKGAAFAILALIVIVGVTLAILQKNWIELLPVAGALLQTGGLWFNSEQTIRKFALAGAPFWLIYNLLSQAYGVALGSVLSIVSIVISLVRYRKPKVKADSI